MEFMLAESLDTAQNPKFDDEKMKILDELEKRGDTVCEKKKDGSRVGIGRENGKITIPNRRGVDYARQKNVPELIQIANALPDGTFLDGEATALCNPANCPHMNGKEKKCLYPCPGRECRIFGQRRMGTTTLSKVWTLEKLIPIQFEPFDILRYRGEDVEKKPFLERKDLLKEIVKEMSLPSVQLVWYQKSGFKELFRSELEGVMLKKTWARYLHDRVRYWMKCKHTHRKIGSVVGFTEGQGKNASLWGSLVLVKDERVIGRCGGGFTDLERQQIKQQFLTDKHSTYDTFWRRWIKHVNKPWTAVKTNLQIEVLYQEESKFGIMYAPRKFSILEP